MREERHVARVQLNRLCAIEPLALSLSLSPSLSLSHIYVCVCVCKVCVEGGAQGICFKNMDQTHGTCNLVSRSKGYT